MPKYLKCLLWAGAGACVSDPGVHTVTGPGLACPGLAAVPVLEASGVCSLSTATSPAAGGGPRGVASRVWAGRPELTRYGALGAGLIPGQLGKSFI